tara:strand:- start:24 stop:629 length:606 start_codon:yes stop_codon:yes gene_type:complete
MKNPYMTEINKEIWVNVPGFEKSYQVNNFGQIKLIKSGKIKITTLDKNGYEKVNLWKNGEQYHTTMHRLVAKTFLGTPKGKEVNHKNGIKNDNHLSNLEWLTRSENMIHSYRVLGRTKVKYWLGKKMPKACLVRLKGFYNDYSKPVVAYNGMGFGYLFFSIGEAQRTMDFNASHIVKCTKGIRNTHKGYHWKSFGENYGEY